MDGDGSRNVQINDIESKSMATPMNKDLFLKMKLKNDHDMIRKINQDHVHHEMDEVDSKRQLFLNTIWSKFWLILDSVFLMVTVLAQGSILNYYIIYYNDGKSLWYFMFLIDFFLIILFLISILTANKYNKKESDNEDASISMSLSMIPPSSAHTAQSSASIFTIDSAVENPSTQNKSNVTPTNNKKTHTSILDNIQALFPPCFGYLPLFYLDWLCYSIFLIARMFIIIQMDIPTKMLSQPHGMYGMNEWILEVTFAGSSLVFLLWIEAHLNIKHINKHMTNCNNGLKYTKNDLISHVVFELFDSIAFLDLITPEKNGQLNSLTSPSLHSPSIIRDIILCFTAISFIIPTVSLFRLSKLRFGFKKNKQTPLEISTTEVGLSVLIHLLKLLLVNIPYLLIRIHVTTEFGEEMSIFVFKNLLGIIISSRWLIPELMNWYMLRRKSNQQKNQLNPPKIRIEFNGDDDEDDEDGSRGVIRGINLFKKKNTRTKDESVNEIELRYTSASPKTKRLTEEFGFEDDVSTPAINSNTNLNVQNGYLRRHV